MLSFSDIKIALSFLNIFFYFFCFLLIWIFYHTSFKAVNSSYSLLNSALGVALFSFILLYFDITSNFFQISSSCFWDCFIYSIKLWLLSTNLLKGMNLSGYSCIVMNFIAALLFSKVVIFLITLVSARWSETYSTLSIFQKAQLLIALASRLFGCRCSL